MTPLRALLAGFRAPIRSRSSVAAAATTATGCPFHQPQQATSITATGSGHKPYEAIPTPKGLPLIGTALDIIMSGGAAKLHEYCDRRHKELGPIFREKLGSLECVMVSKKEYIYSIYAQEGQFPEHLVPEPWLLYNAMRNIERGLFFMDGSQWLDRRKLLNRILMGAHQVDRYGVEFNGVITDLLQRWEKLAENDKNHIVPNVETELYNWAIESLGTMMFGRRLGCVIPANQPNKMHEFVHHIRQIFIESAKMALIPPKLAAGWNLPVWRRFVKAADNALKMSRGYVVERISEINALRSQGAEVHGVLSELLDVKDMKHEEIISIVSDLILAAADTTSHATQWALHSLARNPECQEQLLAEIKKAAPNGEMITEKHLNEMPYSMYVIKETLRMYPIASFLTRTLPEKIVLGEYEVPAGVLFSMSQYTVGRDEERFPEPHKFIPERWIRTGPRTEKTSHCCMPFGIGARSCIGRRVAELKMRLLLSRAVQQFHLESANEKEVGISLRMITTSDQPIKLRLRKRQT